MVNRAASIALLLAALAAPASAGPGTTAADSLNLGMGPRATAMGEAFTGQSDDLFALHWNPAGLARLYDAEAAFSYLNLFDDTRQHYLAFAWPEPGRGRAYGLGLSYLKVDPFAAYDNTGGRSGTVEAADLVFSAAAAQRWDRWAAGAAVKYVHSELAGIQAQTPSMDLGVSFLSRRPVTSGRLDFGLAAQNLFGALKYDSESFPLPRTFRAGVSFAKTLLADDVLTLNADLVQSDAADGLQASYGAEYWLLNLVALRAGMAGGQDVGSGLRMGLGFRLRGFHFDYSWAGFGELGTVHRAAVTVKFGRAREPQALEVRRLFERADYLSSQGRHLEEVIELDRILDLDPTNLQALEKMKAAAEKASKPGKEAKP